MILAKSSSSPYTYFMSEESISTWPSSAMSSFSLPSSEGRRDSLPAIPVPFIRSRIVLNFPDNDLSKRSTCLTSFMPLLSIASQQRGDISIAVTSWPISCRARLWHPAPAPTSSILPYDMSKAFLSISGISSGVRSKWLTGSSSSSNIGDKTLSGSWCLCPLGRLSPCRDVTASRMAAPIGSFFLSIVITVKFPVFSFSCLL